MDVLYPWMIIATTLIANLSHTFFRKEHNSASSPILEIYFSIRGVEIYPELSCYKGYLMVKSGKFVIDASNIY